MLRLLPLGFDNLRRLLGVDRRAMCSRKKVAYFEAGDLSKRQVEVRFMVRAAGHPYRSGNVRKPYWPYAVHYPVAVEVDDDPKSGRRRARITSTRDKEYTQALDQAKAWTACQKVMQTQVKSARSHFKLSV